MKYYDFVDDFNVYASACQKYNKKKKKFMGFFLIIFGLSLIISALIFAYLLINNRNDKIVYNSCDISLVAQSDEYGASLSDIRIYNSMENSYLYSFYIKNSCNKIINYTVTMDSNFDYSGNLFYSLYKNDIQIYTGLIDNNSITLLSDKINVNSNDNFVIKIFSGGYNGSFDFKINVKSGE